MCGTSGALPPVDIDFIRRIHGHFGRNQARREKTRKTVEQATAPIERRTSRCKSLGRFNEQRNSRRKEARPVCRWESEDCESGEKAVGEGSASEESGGIVLMDIGHRLRSIREQK